MTRDLFDLLAAVVDYPDEHLPAVVVQAAAQASAPAVTAPLESFAEVLDQLSIDELREHYVTTFDVARSCSLEIGFHLYRDAYERGAFLVRLLDGMRRIGYEPRGQLPDHLTCVLALIARDEPDHAADFALKITPAVDQMRRALIERHSPYAEVIGAVRAALPQVRPVGVKS
jgi:nitrate reductase delta subunit